MKNIKKCFCTLLMLVLLVISFCINANAATGYEGHAVYRDEALLGTNWHAGIMTSANFSDYNPVVQADMFYDVKLVSWATFKDDGVFKGIFKPKIDPNNYYRDLFVLLGKELATQEIGYNILYQVYYDTSTAGDYVNPSEISSMRCDGVVEYIYEWYYFRVYGNDTYWNVTKNSYTGRDQHSGILITPKTQPNYLTIAY